MLRYIRFISDFSNGILFLSYFCLFLRLLANTKLCFFSHIFIPIVHFISTWYTLTVTKKWANIHHGRKPSMDTLICFFCYEYILFFLPSWCAIILFVLSLHRWHGQMQRMPYSNWHFIRLSFFYYCGMFSTLCKELLLDGLTYVRFACVCNTDVEDVGECSKCNAHKARLYWIVILERRWIVLLRHRKILCMSYDLRTQNGKAKPTKPRAHAFFCFIFALLWWSFFFLLLLLLTLWMLKCHSFYFILVAAVISVCADL